MVLTSSFKSCSIRHDVHSVHYLYFWPCWNKEKRSLPWLASIATIASKIQWGVLQWGCCFLQNSHKDNKRNGRPPHVESLLCQSDWSRWWINEILYKPLHVWPAADKERPDRERKWWRALKTWKLMSEVTARSHDDGQNEGEATKGENERSRGQRKSRQRDGDYTHGVGKLIRDTEGEGNKRGRLDWRAKRGSRRETGIWREDETKGQMVARASKRARWRRRKGGSGCGRWKQKVKNSI